MDDQPALKLAALRECPGGCGRLTTEPKDVCRDCRELGQSRRDRGGLVFSSRDSLNSDGEPRVERPGDKKSMRCHR